MISTAKITLKQTENIKNSCFFVSYYVIYYDTAYIFFSGIKINKTRKEECVIKDDQSI